MKVKNLAKIFLVISLLIVGISGCTEQPEPETKSEVQDKLNESSAILTPLNQLSTLAIESTPGLTFLYPLAHNHYPHPHQQLDRTVDLYIEFFKVVDGEVQSTPVGPRDLTTINGNIHPFGILHPRFYASWHTHKYGFDNGDIVRLEVRLKNAPEDAPACNDGVSADKGCLGFLDVQMWNTLWDVITNGRLDDGILDIRNGWWVPIKFHLARGSINFSPTLDISSPEADVTFTTSDTIQFTATATDAEDGDLTAAIQWSAEGVDQEIPVGGSVELQLPVGDYTFTATVKDSQDVTVTQNITIKVVQANTIPELVITSPEDNADFTTTDTIQFIATATDAEDGDLTASIQWSAEGVSQEIPVGGSVELKLPAGDYTFTATVQDSHGASVVQSRAIKVTEAPVNTNPTLSITSPEANQSFTTADTIKLVATATDAEDGDLTAVIQWSAEGVDQEIPVGGSVELQLPVGDYTFVATVKDTQDAADSKQISFSVTVPASEFSLAVTGSAPCNLSNQGGDFYTNLAFRDAAGSSVMPTINIEDIRFSNVQVIDENGNAISTATLSPKHFVTEEQDSVGAHILILFDQSGSVTNFDKQNLRFVAAKKLIERLRPNDKAAVAVQAGNSGIDLLQDFTSDKTKLSSSLENVRIGYSNVYSALTKSVDLFKSVTNGQKIIIQITDGEDPDYYLFSQAVSLAKENNVNIFPIAIDIQSSTSEVYLQLLRWMACETGGSFYNFDKPESADAIFKKISQTINGMVVKNALNFSPSLATQTNYFLQGQTIVDVSNKRASTNFKVPFRIEAPIPSAPKLISASINQAPTIADPQTPITIVADNLYMYVGILIGKEEKGIYSLASLQEMPNEVLTYIPDTDVANAGTTTISIRTPFGTSNSLPFTYLAEYEPEILEFKANPDPVKVGQEITFTWNVRDQGGDTLNCRLRLPTDVPGVYEYKYTIPNCGNITSQKHTFTSMPIIGNIELYVSDGTTREKSQSLRFTVEPAAPTPKIISITPTKGPRDGGAQLVITGENFTNASKVRFHSRYDDTSAASFTVDSATQITVTTPQIGPNYGNTRSIEVETPLGGRSNRLEYTLVNKPSLRYGGITPAEGVGGISVKIAGSSLNEVTEVYFGDVRATSFTVNSNSELTAVVPAQVQGQVQVKVVSIGGTSNTQPFTYLNSTPNLTSLAPNQGLNTGGTSVVITGTNLFGATSVSFGGVAATSFTQDSATQLTAISPAGTGQVTVTVTTPSGTSGTLPFTYLVPPKLMTIVPSEGAATGGASVVIMGESLAGASSVKFGNVEATSFSQDSDTQITAVAPAGSGNVEIVVTTASGISNGLAFSYVPAPVISSISPNTGGVAGGTSVVITGTNLSRVNAVRFGDVAATSFTVDSATQITAVSPAKTAGAVDVVVVSPFGESKATYTYNQPPTIKQLTVSPHQINLGDEVTLSWNIEDVEQDTLTCTIKVGNQSINVNEIDGECKANQTFTFPPFSTLAGNNINITLEVTDNVNSIVSQVITLGINALSTSELSASARTEVIDLVVKWGKEHKLDFDIIRDNNRESAVNISGLTVFMLFDKSQSNEYPAALYGAIQDNEVVMLQQYISLPQQDLLQVRDFILDIAFFVENVSQLQKSNDLAVREKIARQILTPAPLQGYVTPLISLSRQKADASSSSAFLQLQSLNPCSIYERDAKIPWSQEIGLNVGAIALATALWQTSTALPLTAGVAVKLVSVAAYVFLTVNRTLKLIKNQQRWANCITSQEGYKTKSDPIAFAIPFFRKTIARDVLNMPLRYEERGTDDIAKRNVLTYNATEAMERWSNIDPSRPVLRKNVNDSYCQDPRDIEAFPLRCYHLYIDGNALIGHFQILQ